jgi:hypothetical protein
MSPEVIYRRAHEALFTDKVQLAGIHPLPASWSLPVAALSKIATVYTMLVLSRPEGRFLQDGGIPGVFSEAGLASALWSFDLPVSVTSLPQIAFLASLLLLAAAMNGGSGIGELAGARRALGS